MKRRQFLASSTAALFASSALATVAQAANPPRVGYEGRHEYTAVGNVANLASRLCSSTRDGQILADPIAAAASDAIVLALLDSRTLKGLAEPVQVYALANGQDRMPE